MVQYSDNIVDLAKGTPGGKQGRGWPYLGSFHAAAEAAASKFRAVEATFRWDALRQGSCFQTCRVMRVSPAYHLSKRMYKQSGG